MQVPQRVFDLSNLRRLFPAYLTVLLWNISWSISITGPILPLYIEKLGIGILGWGTLAAAFAAGMFLFEWVWGSLSDRTERLYLMLASVLCMSLLFVLYTFHGSFVLFVILQLLSGAVGVALGPITRSYVTEISSEKSVGLYSSLWWVFLVFGGVIGPIIGTYIAQTMSFAYSFYTSSALSILLALLIVIFFSRKRNRTPKDISGSILRNLNFVLRRQSALLLFLSTVFAEMGFSVIRSFLPLYASGQALMPTVEVGILIATVAAAELVSMPLLGWVSDKFGRKRTAISAFTLSAAAFLLYFFAGTSYEVFLVSITVGIGLSGTSLLLAMIPDVTPTATYGTAVGIFGSFEDLGITIGPLVYGFVWSTTSPVYIFAAAAASQILSAALLSAIEQKHEVSTLSHSGRR